MVARSGFGFLMLVLASACVWPAGCSTTTNMRLGQRAESRGRYHIAYQYYCDEAKLQPSRGAVRTAIARVAPHAAQHYERRATRAMDAGAYADAWKLHMRALAITPNDAAIAQLIKMLEEHHPHEIAPAKRAWMKQGAVALAVSSSNSGWAGTPPQVRAEVQNKPETAREPPTQTVKVVAQDGSHGELQDKPLAPEQPTGTQQAQTPKADGGYLLTVILSVEDRRFPQKTHLVDDIHVKLKDTDDDPDADLDVYLGTKRVEKARDVETGEHIRVRGRSGKWYEVVVVTIVDRTESVRIGIRPLYGPSE